MLQCSIKSENVTTIVLRRARGRPLITNVPPRLYTGHVIRDSFQYLSYAATAATASCSYNAKGILQTHSAFAVVSEHMTLPVHLPQHSKAQHCILVPKEASLSIQIHPLRDEVKCIVKKCQLTY